MKRRKEVKMEMILVLERENVEERGREEKRGGNTRE